MLRPVQPVPKRMRACRLLALPCSPRLRMVAVKTCRWPLLTSRLLGCRSMSGSGCSGTTDTVLFAAPAWSQASCQPTPNRADTEVTSGGAGSA
jgi:hypothetical protein